MKNFKKLTVWNKGIELTATIYNLVKILPPEERFELSSQLRRSAVSIPSNISEGASRKSDKDNARFVEIALGSSFELETQIIIAQKTNLITESHAEEVLNQLKYLQPALSKYHEGLLKDYKRIITCLALLMLTLLTVI